ncbi:MULTISPECIES: hypothetical protein [unclassified Neisseria]|nr:MULTISPECIES: hypothetical protein [unclassified Neisseria]MBF0802814.1 hypothetical protein [Neisseria sp. 19428wB4_WF04]
MKILKYRLNRCLDAEESGIARAGMTASETFAVLVNATEIAGCFAFLML